MRMPFRPSVTPSAAQEPRTRTLPAHDEAVGVERGGKQQQIRAAIPRADRLAVVHRAGEAAEIRKADLICIRLDLGAILTIADEDHAEIMPRLTVALQAIEDDAQALIPHHAAEEEEDRHVAGEVPFRAQRLHGGGVCLAPVEIDAVRHDKIIALIAERAQVLPRSLADNPDLVAGGDVRNEQVDRRLLHELGADGLGDVDIELRVIGEDDRDIARVAQGAGEHRGRDGTVRMDEIAVHTPERLDRLGREGISRAIARELRGVKARIAHDGKRIVVRHAGIIRRRHDAFAVAERDMLCVIHNGVRHPVNRGREGVVHEADV